MNEHFKIMFPYRTAKSNEEYSDDIRALVRYIRSIGVKVFGLDESDILDENKQPIEHVYLLRCFGNPDILNNIFGERTTGYNGETVIYS